MTITTSAIGTDALSIIKGLLAQYGLTSLATWAWNEITSGASTNQVVLDMYNTPQFKQRFPGIGIRQQKGLPPISPATYVSYEDQMAQLQNTYGLPQGFLTTAKRIGTMIGNDVSASEVQARVQQGYQAVAYAPPEVRQYFTATFGASGDGALASYFLDQNHALPLLEQQATAAQLGGIAAMGSVHMTSNDAMRLAEMGASASQMSSATQKLETQAPLFDQSVTEQHGMSAGQQGMEAAFGLNQQATQQVTQRQQQREAEFSGGGAAYLDQYGAPGVGAARPE